jgi:hypothetical protein
MEVIYFSSTASYTAVTDLYPAIVGMDLLGPVEQARKYFYRDPKPDELPKLRILSDLYWAYWVELHDKAGPFNTIKNLNTYIVGNVHNTNTDQVITRALRTRQKEHLESWPGQYFETEIPEGLALLGKSSSFTNGNVELSWRSQFETRVLKATDRKRLAGTMT